MTRALGRKQGLGVHSGAIGDGIADLMEAGIVDNRHKEIDPAVTVATMRDLGPCLGGKSKASRGRRSHSGRSASQRIPSAWVKLISSGTLLIVRECSDTRFKSR